MNKAQLRELLKEQTGKTATVPGYNYAIYSITVPVSQIDEVIKRLRAHKPQIEKAMQAVMKEARPEVTASWKLLPFVCLQRKRSVLIPVPLHTPINAVVDALPELPEGVKFPSWN